VGSAQARRRGTLLQHGSIPLSADQELWERAFGEHPLVHGVDDFGVTLNPQRLAAAWGEALGVAWQ
jgi:lipoate-protein ligase A